MTASSRKVLALVGTNHLQLETIASRFEPIPNTTATAALLPFREGPRSRKVWDVCVGLRKACSEEGVKEQMDLSF